MYLLLSGEGISDLGRCSQSVDCCAGEDFTPGAMARLLDRILEELFDYSLIDYAQIEYLSESYLVKQAKHFKARRKAPSLPGKKKRQETLYFYRNAYALAVCASEKRNEMGMDVIAVLFRDADGTASAERGEWQAKWDSMIKGFADAGFEHGVPMLPKPKSEAWLLCALGRQYQHCDSLEQASGNDAAPNSLKVQLAQLIGDVSAETLQQRVADGEVDPAQINMPAFNVFKERLITVVNMIT